MWCYIIVNASENRNWQHKRRSSPFSAYCHILPLPLMGNQFIKTMNVISQARQIAVLLSSLNAIMSQIRTHFDNNRLSSRLDVCGDNSQRCEPRCSGRAAPLSFWYRPCWEISGGISSLHSDMRQKALEGLRRHLDTACLCVCAYVVVCVCAELPYLQIPLTSQNRYLAHQKAVVK